MKQQSWEIVVATFHHLGCTIVRETEFRVTLCRGATKLLDVHKLSPVTVRAQRKMVEILEFDESEFMEAIGKD